MGIWTLVSLWIRAIIINKIGIQILKKNCLQSTLDTFMYDFYKYVALLLWSTVFESYMSIYTHTQWFLEVHAMPWIVYISYKVDLSGSSSYQGSNFPYFNNVHKK